MNTEIEVLFNIHFLTFLLSEIAILTPILWWYLMKFTPAKNYFLNSEYEQFLKKVAEEYVLSAPYEAAACLYLLEAKSKNGGFKSLKELRIFY